MQEYGLSFAVMDVYPEEKDRAAAIKRKMIHSSGIYGAKYFPLRFYMENMLLLDISKTTKEQRADIIRRRRDNVHSANEDLAKYSIYMEVTKITFDRDPVPKEGPQTFTPVMHILVGGKSMSHDSKGAAYTLDQVLIHSNNNWRRSRLWPMREKKCLLKLD